ncbi:MAG: PepSY-like domain-containing protein [Bacteroidota bacterium]
MNRSFLKFWVVVALATTFVACQQAEELIQEFFTGEVETIAESELPSDVLDQVMNTFPSVGISSITRVVGSNGAEVFEISLDNGETLSFTRDGGGCVEVAIEDLPAGVQDYVDTNYAGEMITKAMSMEHDGDSIYTVRISSGEILTFDASGDFLGIRERRGRRGHHKRHGEIIEASALPGTAQTYISDNFAGAVVDKAVQITKRDGTVVYLVKLDTGERLAFDSDGNYLDDFRPGWGN